MKENLGLLQDPITMELTKRGVTDDQLAAMRFRGSSRGKRFDDWSFIWANGMPLEAMPFVKVYCALKWLIFDDPPASREKDDAWRYGNDAMLAPVIAVGLKHQEAQKRRAQRPRVKVTDDGQTFKQVVERFVCKPENSEEGAPQLWPRFFAELDQLGLDPEEVTPSNCRKPPYEYTFGYKRRRISYRQFANLVSRSRAGKSG
jgi:hypothetical protein